MDRKALTEAEAFEYVFTHTKAEDRIKAIEQENEDLRNEIRVLAEQNKMLREYLARNQEDYYE